MSQGRTFVYQDQSYQVVDADSIEYWDKLPYCLKVLMENVLRHSPEHVDRWHDAFAGWLKGERPEIAFSPSRVLMQDLTGVPAIVDLTAMRDAMQAMGGDAAAINPKCGVDLVIDHSVTVDFAKTPDAFAQNVALEVQKNRERYELLKWAQGAFENVRIVPPGKGICHQVNLEYLADVVSQKAGWLFPDTLVGLDSHTTMINGLGVLGWGVGGIEAEAAMLGQEVSLNIPDVVGVSLEGKLKPGVTATDLVLHLTEFLRSHGVVGKFVEFVGEGALALALAERATIANMAPEFGATCAFFPVDDVTLDYMALTGRDQEQIDRARAYLVNTRMFWDAGKQAQYSDLLVFPLDQVEPCVAGPKRPEQRLALKDVKPSIQHLVCDREKLSDGSVVIAAITSCTNTSNPSVLIAAGMLARNAQKMGLKVPTYVKSSFAPGSRVVMDYLEKLELVGPLEELGFYLVGFGCTTCIGNSGPLDPQIADTIDQENLTVSAVLSGNRNFEGRVHPQTQLNYLASPPLVVAYALSGSVHIDFEEEPLGEYEGKPVYLRDIWPSDIEVEKAIMQVSREMFHKEYQAIFEGTADWEAINIQQSELFPWDESSTYIRKPNFFEGGASDSSAKEIVNARILAILGDSVTTDHISPAAAIPSDSEAANYLRDQGVSDDALHSYGARRGNAEVMVRGTFANIRLQNKMSQHVGGYTTYYPDNVETSIYDCAMRYIKAGHGSVVFAGKFYGTGSSRDWAAKGTKLLGVKAVIAESFERIHRSNLIGMGVLPCELLNVATEDLALIGDEEISLLGVANLSKPGETLELIIQREGQEKRFTVKVAIDTVNELKYYQSGGILSHVLKAGGSA